MAQITSRAEFEEWLEDQPNDRAQVIAVRAALRVLPYAFGAQTPQNWVNGFALSLIRANAISWIAHNLPAHEMAHAARTVAFDAAGAAGLDAAQSAVPQSAAAAAAYAGYTAYFVAAAAAASAYAVDAASAYASSVWAGIDADCRWLDSRDNEQSAARQLTRKVLWLGAEADGWHNAWKYATHRLRTLDQCYDVWIDWYDRRIGDNRAAFDISGDTRHVEDKKILARLADATNKVFWDKGATYVNTTLQSWIDEARERASAKRITDTEIEIVEAPKPAASDRINFFISYATVDEAMAREVEAVLAELGYTSIAQFKDFKQSSFVRSMREGLAKSERFIALYSKAYWSSDHCQSEWDAAYARDPGAKRRKIVPFLLEAMDLRQQPLASEIVYEPLHGLSKDERKKAIKQMIEYQPNAPLA